ncbi:MAG: anti-sigma factor antagonist [Lachnospiraceae bacterium]
MEKKYRVIKKCLFVPIQKELDHYQTDIIKKEIDGYLVTHQVQHIAFDFSETEFVDSSGIGLIMGRYEKLHYSGGKIFVMGIQPAVRRIFLMSGLNKIIYIKENERDVLASL